MTCETPDETEEDPYRSGPDCTAPALGPDLTTWGFNGEAMHFHGTAEVSFAELTVISKIDVHFMGDSYHNSKCSLDIEYESGNGAWSRACTLTADPDASGRTSSDKSTCDSGFSATAVATVRLVLLQGCEGRGGQWFRLTGLDLYGCPQAPTDRRLEAGPVTSAAIVDDFLSTRPDYRAALDARTIEIMTEMMEHSQHFGLPASAQGNRASAKTMTSNWEGQPTI